MYSFKEITYKLLLNNTSPEFKNILEIYKDGVLVSELTTLKGYHKEDKENSYQSFFKYLRKESDYKSLPTSGKFAASMLNEINLQDKRHSIDTAKLILLDGKDLGTINTPIVKIKVGRKDPRAENKQIIKLLKNSPCNIRLDGNRLCDSDKMNQILKNIPSKRIDYVEDSFVSNKEEKKFFESNKEIKLAMDEEIADLFQKKQINSIPNHISHVVIKMSLIGGVEELSTLIYQLENLQKTYNLSSTFEGPLGINFLNNIWKKKIFSSMTLPGIDTLKYLEKRGEQSLPFTI